MEIICILDRAQPSCGGALRMAVKRRHEDLQCKHRAAPAVTASLRFPHCVGNSVCTDGNQRRKDLYVTAICRPKQRAKPIFCTADRQFLLEPNFLQRPGIRICFLLAVASVDSGPMDDPGFLQDRSPCRQTSDPIFDLVIICGIPEPWCLVSEPLAGLQGKRPAEAGRFPLNELCTFDFL